MDDLAVGDRATIERWDGVGKWELAPPPWVVVAEVLPGDMYRLGHQHPDLRFRAPVHRSRLRRGWVS